jgi:hypothetical protein
MSAKSAVKLFLFPHIGAFDKASFRSIRACGSQRLLL